MKHVLISNYKAQILLGIKLVHPNNADQYPFPSAKMNLFSIFSAAVYYLDVLSLNFLYDIFLGL